MSLSYCMAPCPVPSVTGKLPDLAVTGSSVGPHSCSKRWETHTITNWLWSQKDMTGIILACCWIDHLLGNFLLTLSNAICLMVPLDSLGQAEFNESTYVNLRQIGSSPIFCGKIFTGHKFCPIFTKFGTWCSDKISQNLATASIQVAF